MAAIGGQPGTKPSALNKPVPGAEAAMTADDLLSSFDAPEMPSQAGASEVPKTADDLLNSMGAAEPVAPPEGMAPPQDEFAPEPGFLQGNMQQFQDFTTRLQAGLAANDTEKLGFLQKKFGAENAKVKNDKLYFRKPGEKIFRALDPDTFEIISDILPDFAREIITETAMLPGEAAGTAIGTLGGAAAGTAVAPGPGTVVGAGTGLVSGAIAGRVASVPLANYVADKVAEFAGVPQDETRSKLTENAIGMTAEAVLPFVGAKIAKYIPGTGAAQRAYKVAKEKGEREIIALSKQSDEVLKATQSLAEQGRGAQINGAAIGLPDANVNLMGHHLNPDNPILTQYAAQAASDPRFINAQTQLAEDWGASLTNTLTEIGRRGNKGPYSPEHLASSVTNAVADLQRAEGQAIGKFKAKALANLKNAPQPLSPGAMQKTNELMQELGFKVQAKGDAISIIPPKNPNDLIGKLGLTSIGEVRAVINNVEAIAKGMQKGLPVTEIDRLRNSVGAASDSLFRTPAGAKLGALSGDLRQMYRDTIAKGLPEDFDKAAFNSAMDEFSALKTNVGVLKNALNEDASAKAIVRNVFTGKENLEKVRAIKRISPESYAGLKEEFVNQMLLDYGSRANKTGFKSTQFLDAINKKYGDEFLREVMDDGKGPGLKTVKELLTVTERLDDTFRKADIDKMSEKQKTGLMNATIGLMLKSPVKAVSGIGSILTGSKGTENALTQIMTRDGIEKYIANYPGKIPDKVGLYQQLSNILAEQRIYQLGEKAAGRATKAATKEEMMDKSR
jgi:hypothetical protein